MPDRLRLTCADLHRDADLVADLVPDVFGAHDCTNLDPDDQCYCAKPVEVGRWDEENRREYNRRCHDPHIIIGNGFRMELCCGCTDEAGLILKEEYAAAAARIAKVLRAGAGAMHRDPAIGAAIAVHRKAGASSTEAALLASLDLIEAAAGGGR